LHFSKNFWNESQNKKSRIKGCDSFFYPVSIYKYFVPLESKFYKMDDNTYSFIDAGGLKGLFSIDKNYNLVTLVYNNVDLLALEQN